MVMSEESKWRCRDWMYYNNFYYLFQNLPYMPRKMEMVYYIFKFQSINISEQANLQYVLGWNGQLDATQYKY